MFELANVRKVKSFIYLLHIDVVYLEAVITAGAALILLYMQPSLYNIFL